MIIVFNSFTKYFVNMYWNCWNKIAHYAFNCMCRNTPDSEKTKDMINSKSIEIITHLSKSLLPPSKSIFLHFLPIVSWKTPVLAFNCKCIWRCSCLQIHIIQRCILPCIRPISINTNGNISLYNYSFIVAISCCFI